MKRILSIALILMLMTLMGCGNMGTAQTELPTGQESTSTTQATDKAQSETQTQTTNDQVTQDGQDKQDTQEEQEEQETQEAQEWPQEAAFSAYEAGIITQSFFDKGVGVIYVDETNIDEVIAYRDKLIEEGFEMTEVSIPDTPDAPEDYVSFASYSGKNDKYSIDVSWLPVSTSNIPWPGNHMLEIHVNPI